MKVTRRGSLLAIGAAMGAIVVKSPLLARLRRLPEAIAASGPRTDGGPGRAERPRPSRSVEPAPHSVKRHA